MAKAKAAMVGTLVLMYPQAIREIGGALVEQTEEYFVLDVKKPRSSKTIRHMVPVSSVKTAMVSESDAYLYVSGELREEYPNTTLVEVSNGYFSGTNEDGLSVMVAPGLWMFMPDSEEAAEKPTKGKAEKAAAEKPAKGKKEEADEEEAAEKPTKGKKKPEPEPEPDGEDYWPEQGDNVKFTYEEEEVTGEVEKVTPKSITVGGEKYAKDDISDLEKVEGEADEGGDEFEPEVGSYVTVTNEDEEETTGEVTALTSKKITIKDGDDEEHSFTLAKVTVTEAEKPEPKGKGKGKPKETPAEKPAKGKAKKEDEGDDW